MSPRAPAAALRRSVPQPLQEDPPCPEPSQLTAEQKANFKHWELIKDVSDQLIDLMLDTRQSGHPGGSRSNAHTLISLMLSGAMRWDIRHPEKRFADRFVLVAGHCAPLVYAVLAVCNEAMRWAHEKTGDQKYLVPGGPERVLTWEDLKTLRHRGGLPRPRGDGGQEPVLQVEHRPQRPRQHRRRGPGPGPEDRRRHGRQGVRLRRRGRPHRRLLARGQEQRLRPGAWTTCT